MPSSTSPATFYHWDAHRPVLLLRNLAAEEGDRRFQKVRRRALAPVIERLAAYHREIETFGATRADLVETCARLLLQTLIGRTA
jgi:hypothetical protein